MQRLSACNFDKIWRIGTSQQVPKKFKAESAKLQKTPNERAKSASQRPPHNNVVALLSLQMRNVVSMPFQAQAWKES